MVTPSASAFQPTLPARGATVRWICKCDCGKDFNPRSPHGERRRKRRRCQQFFHFNPRSPHGERLTGKGGKSNTPSHFNPRSPHGERRNATRSSSSLPTHFNPRSPHGERPRLMRCFPTNIVFQPTLPARGATYATAKVLQAASDFNPRSPHGERRWDDINKAYSAYISTHAPRTGSDDIAEIIITVWVLFQPTLPARGAT